MNEPVGVLVIGAGASGAAFAWRIADIGTSVLCLEQGPWMRQQDYPSNGLDWEARGMGKYSPSPNVRGLSADYPVNEQDSEISPLMFNAVGGSTILWAAHFPRLTPSDFRTKTGLDKNPIRGRSVPRWAIPSSLPMATSQRIGGD